MNERATAIYDVYECEVVLPADAANGTISDALRERQSNEDKEAYLFDFLFGDGHDVDREAHAAADDHVDGLRKAQGDLDEALNLSKVLRSAMEQDGDSRAMQADTVLRVIEKKVEKAHDRVDKHAARCERLFLGYCESQQAPDEPA